MRLFVVALVVTSLVSDALGGGGFFNVGEDPGGNGGKPPGFPSNNNAVGGRSFGCYDFFDECPPSKFYCTLPNYQSFMETWCPLTCGMCGTENVCKDTYEWWCTDAFADCTQEWEKENCQKTCNTCPGVWSDYGPWGKCSKDCGEGKRRRTRTCSGGKCTGDAYEEESCNTQQCQTAGVWRPFGNWKACSKPCGGGTQRRTRTCKSGTCSGKNYEDRQCNIRPCRWGNWGSYGKCSKPCNGGTQTRSRQCETGGSCSGSSTSSRDCNTQPCPGVWGPFGSWNACSKPCGAGTQRRTRTCQSGTCSGKNYEDRQCNTRPCRWGNWGSYGKCSKPCDGGTQTRSRQCETGGSCSGSSTSSRACNTQLCPTSCTTPPSWKPWSNWSACNEKCGGGKRTKTRECDRPCPNGSDCSGSTLLEQDCNTHKCQTEDGCSQKCGYGVKESPATDTLGDFTKYTMCNSAKCTQQKCGTGQEKMKTDAELRCCDKPNPNGCGVPDFDFQVTPRIIGGKNTNPKEIPWQVFLMPTFCGAVIVHRRWILTAGHCVAYSGNGFRNLVPAGQFRVFYGKIYLSDTDRAQHGDTIIKRVIRHPSFKFPLHDIAVMELTISLTWSPTVRPACLPSTTYAIPDDTTCHVSGFGVASKTVKVISDNLQDVGVEKFNMNICKSGYRGLPNYDIVMNHGEKFICAGSLDGRVDSCMGDSGGALVCQHANSCSFTVTGIVSFGPPSECAKLQVPGMYINVAYYRKSFIDKYVK